MSGHAILSASGAHRWMACTPSARLELEFEDNSGEAAAEGTDARQDRDGNYNVKVGFAEPRSDARSPGGGVSNAKIAAVLEYGKHGQPAKPFLKPAKSASRKACISAMTAKLDEEIEGL